MLEKRKEIGFYPIGIVTMGMVPFSPVSTRVKTNSKKENIF
jgi:hypothetical protein